MVAHSGGIKVNACNVPTSLNKIIVKFNTTDLTIKALIHESNPDFVVRRQGLGDLPVLVATRRVQPHVVGVELHEP